jgi:hypothetical protein
LFVTGLQGDAGCVGNHTHALLALMLLIVDLATPYSLANCGTGKPLSRISITCALIPYLHVADDDVLATVERDAVCYAVLDDEWSIGGVFLVLEGYARHSTAP